MLKLMMIGTGSNHVLLFLAIVGFLGITTDAHSEDNLDRLLQSFASRQHHEADFVEKKHSSILTQVIETRGRLSFQAPDKLTKYNLHPVRETLVADGNTLQLNREVKGKIKTRSTSLQSATAIAPFIIGLRSTFSGNRLKLEENFKTLLVGDSSQWRLQLQPRSADGSEEEYFDDQISRIEIKGKGTRISDIIVKQVDGDWTRIMLKHK